MSTFVTVMKALYVNRDSQDNRTIYCVCEVFFLQKLWDMDMTIQELRPSLYVHAH